jgi:hypothetical protein
LSHRLRIPDAIQSLSRTIDDSGNFLERLAAQQPLQKIHSLGWCGHTRSGPGAPLDPSDAARLGSGPIIDRRNALPGVVPAFGSRFPPPGSEERGTRAALTSTCRGFEQRQACVQAARHLDRKRKLYPLVTSFHARLGHEDAGSVIDTVDCRHAGILVIGAHPRGPGDEASRPVGLKNPGRPCRQNNVNSLWVPRSGIVHTRVFPSPPVCA